MPTKQMDWNEWQDGSHSTMTPGGREQLGGTNAKLLSAFKSYFLCNHRWSIKRKKLTFQDLWKWRFHPGEAWKRWPVEPWRRPFSSSPPACRGEPSTWGWSATTSWSRHQTTFFKAKWGKNMSSGRYLIILRYCALKCRKATERLLQLTLTMGDLFRPQTVNACFSAL